MDRKLKCPVKDGRSDSLYLKQHHRESGEGQSGHEEKKAQDFLTPAVTAGRC